MCETAPDHYRILAETIRARGGFRALARRLGVTDTAIHEWIARRRVPAERVLALEAALGWRGGRHLWRPDVFSAAGDSPDTMDVEAA